MELALTGRIFGAEEARTFGLAHEVAPNAPARAAEVVQQIAGFSGLAIQKGMQAVHESQGRNWQEAGEVALRARKEVFQSPVFRERLRKWSRH